MNSSSVHKFQFIGGNLALDFVNTVAYRPSAPRDDLPNAATFCQWARQAGLLERKSIHFSSKQFREFRQVREELHVLFHSLAHGASPSNHLLAPLNVRLAAIAPKRQILAEKGALTWGWDLPRDDPGRILATLLSSAADLLVSGHAPRVRQCEDATCGWLFLDRSQAGRRRWCSMADCGNRAKVRTHYQRQTHASRRRTHRGN
jgi:predicted RNA-binding Zn ribbon-like protein